VSNFDTVVVADFEYEVSDGDLPNVLCMVAYVLDSNFRHVRTIRQWRGGFSPTPPFDIGPDAVFVAYSAWAELTCFMQLGWQFPTHIYDLHTSYLAASNILLPYSPDEVRKRQSKRLPDACRAFGIEGWERIDKDSIAKDIGEGRWRDYGQDAVYDYCEEDVRMSTRLLPRLLQGSNRFYVSSTEHVLHWSNYSAKAITQIQARGMPIDTYLRNLVQDHKPEIIRALIHRFDPSQGTESPIYDEEGSFSYERFENWLRLIGCRNWPRLESGRLDIDADAFRLMYHIPGIEGLHALRDSLGVIVRAKLPIGADGRNRPKLFPFCTATGRNAHAQSPVLHGFPRRQDRSLPRLANARGWCCRRTQWRRADEAKKTLTNFPMQGNGAEMLRLAAMRLCDAGIVPCMLVHDAVLIEADNEEQIAHAVEIMKSAGRDVCGGFEIGVDVERMEQGKRYRDKRPVAIRMWEVMMRTLQEIGVLPPGELP
jgi:hypothetical protein